MAAGEHGPGWDVPDREPVGGPRQPFTGEHEIRIYARPPGVSAGCACGWHAEFLDGTPAPLIGQAAREHLGW